MVNIEGKVKGEFPIFVPKIHVPRIQDIPDFFASSMKDMEFECTEKLSGEPITVYFHNGKLGACNRNYELHETADNEIWKVVKRFNLRGIKDLANVALQGILTGWGIPKNYLALRGGPNFYLFNIWDIDKQQYLNPNDRYKFIKYLRDHHGSAIQTVPVMLSNFKVFDSCKNMDKVLLLASGPSLLKSSKQRAGLVFKPNIIGEMPSFKAVNNCYMLAER